MEIEMQTSKLKRYLLAALLMLSMRAEAEMPVIDMASIYGAAQNAMQSYDQSIALYNKTQEQYNQLVQLQNAMSGSVNFAAILHNPLISDYIPADWRLATSNLRGTPEYAACKNAFPYTNNAKLDDVYQTYCYGTASRQVFHKHTDARAREIKRLEAQIGSANSSAEKQVLTARLQMEVAELDADTKLIALFDAEQKDKLAMAERAARHARMCKEFDNKPRACQ